ncbi:MAG: hypothetical protein ABI697_02635 [Devosia sp.]
MATWSAPPPTGALGASAAAADAGSGGADAAADATASPGPAPAAPGAVRVIGVASDVAALGGDEDADASPDDGAPDDASEADTAASDELSTGPRGMMMGCAFGAGRGAGLGASDCCCDGLVDDAASDEGDVDDGGSEDAAELADCDADAASDDVVAELAACDEEAGALLCWSAEDEADDCSDDSSLAVTRSTLTGSDGGGSAATRGISSAPSRTTCAATEAATGQTTFRRPDGTSGSEAGGGTSLIGRP